VAVWDADAELTHSLDYRLVTGGFVTKFWSEAVLGESRRWLSERRYRVVGVDAGGWRSADHLHRALAVTLDFPGYYGNNLAALNDCLRDVALQEYGWSSADTGLVLVLEHYDAFAARDAELAHALLDAFASAAGRAALVGNRLMCLVQSDDPNLEIAPVGATAVSWNDAEWMRAKRRP
jgi:hypothetical protein